MSGTDEQTLTQGAGGSGAREDQTLSLPAQVPAAAPRVEEGTLSLPSSPRPSAADTEGTLSLPSQKAPPQADGMTLSHPGPARSATLSPTVVMNEPAPLIWKAGDFIDGKYEVTGIIGQGGMGIVYKVHHREWNIDMAVKTPLPNLVRDAQAKARFFREAQTWVDLGLHPNIVQCWYVRELSGLPRLFADYISGGSLKQWVQAGNVTPGDWPNIIDLALQACDGLDYAHERGVVHRDVKPGNLLMTPDGRLCVTDFGLVKLAGVEDIPAGDASNAPTISDNDELGMGAAGLTMTGSVMGTPEYGAPEQWGEARHVDARADIYALGIVLYELCCGRRPFDDGSHKESIQAILGRHMMSKPPDPRAFKNDIPEALALAALQCLAKKPDARPQSMRILREMLAGIHTEIAGTPARAVPKAAEARAAGLNNRAVSLWDLNKPDDAFAAWGDALKLDPNHPESVYNKSLLEWRVAAISDHDAEEKLRAAGDAAKRSRLYLGYLNLERLASVEAEEELAEAVKEPAIAADGAAWRALGHARLAQGKLEPARAAYAQAQQLMPKDEILAECQNAITVAVAKPDQAMEILPHRNCIKSFDKNVGSIRVLAATPDGRHLLGGLGDYNMGLWDLPAGNYLRGYLHGKEINALLLTPDGKQIITGGGDANLHLWDLSVERENRNFFGKGHIGAIRALAISRDGAFFVSGGRDKSVRIWNFPQGTLTRTLWGHQDSVEAVAISADGVLAISASDDGTVRLWEMSTGAAAGELQMDASAKVNWRAIAIAGHTVIAGGTDGMLCQWDLGSRQIIRKFKGHRGTVLSAKVTADGTHLLTGGEDHTMRFWELASRRCLRTFSGHSGAVQAVALSHDGLSAFSGSLENTNRPLRRWNLAVGSPSSAGSTAARISATVAPLVVCKVQSQAQSQAANTQFEAHFERAQGAFKTKDHAAVYFALKEARAVPGYERDPRALALNTQLSHLLPRTTLAAGYPRAALAGHAKGIKTAVLSPKGQFIVSAGIDEKTIKLWDVAKGSLLGVFDGHTRAVEGMAVSADGRFLISAGADDTLRLWELSPGGKCLRTFEGHKNNVHAVAVSRDGRVALSGSYDKTLILWELSTGRKIRVFEGHAAPVQAVAITPDGRMAASAGRDGSLKLWSFATGACLKTFSGHAGEVNAIAITPNGRNLISAGEDKTLRAWNLETGVCETVFKGALGTVLALSVTPDSRFVFSGSLEGPQTPIRCWQLSSGQCVRTFGVHPKGISTLAVASDCCWLLSGGADGPIKLWDLEWELDPGEKALKAEAAKKEAAKAPERANPFAFGFKPMALKTPPPMPPIGTVPPPPPPPVAPPASLTKMKRRMSFEDDPPPKGT